MWEVVSSNPDTKRLKVPGGWIVQVGAALTFLSDPMYAWKLGDPVPTPLPEPTPVPEPTPTPVPVPVAPTKWIGTNLSSVIDWSTEYPFRNFMLKSRPPFSAPLSGATWSDTRTLNLDSRGNILSLLADQIARIVVFTTGRPVVDYLLSWEGKGTFRLNGFTINSSPTATSKVVRPAATNNVWIDITAIDATDPLRNISLVPMTQKDLTGLFNPDYVNDLKRYACIRFMDWQNTNVNRPLATLNKDFTPLASLPVNLTGAVPLEVAIELCNQTGVNGWFCVPITADTAYINKFLTTIKDKLNPALKAHVELSNEVWNTIFPQYTLVGGATHDERMFNYAKRASDLGVLTKQILGDRGISIFGAQAAGTWWMDNSLQYLKSQGKVLPEYIATAPYFGGPDDLAIFTDGRLAAAITSQINLTKDAKAIASKFGMKGVLCYEAGQHIGVPGSTGGVAVNRDPRIGDAYKTYLHGIKDALGGSLACHFSYACAYGTSGCWGEKEDFYQADTPKSLAIKQIMSE